jgi:hypothetical protein
MTSLVELCIRIQHSLYREFARFPCQLFRIHLFGAATWQKNKDASFGT